jgi:hypothetical protein
MIKSNNLNPIFMLPKIFITILSLIFFTACASMWILTPEQEKQQWTDFFESKPSKDSVVIFLGFPDKVYEEQGYEVWYWDYGKTTTTRQTPTKTTQTSNTTKAWYMEEGESETTKKQTTTGGSGVIDEQPRFCKLVWKNDEFFSYSVFRYWGKPKNPNLKPY